MDQQPGISTRVVLNYFGPENGMEIKLYQNGGFLKQGSGKISGDYLSGDGRLVVGRQITGWNQNYGSVDLDELLMFNATISEEEIEALWSHA